MIHNEEQIQVEIRCIFAKICQVDTVNERYYAEIYLQSKWREPLLDKSHEDKTVDMKNLWNPKLFIENLYIENRDSISFSTYYPDGKDLAYIIEKRKINATFHETLELKQFPFDCQDLSIIVGTELSCEEVNLCESTKDVSKFNVSAEIDSQEWDIHSHVEVTKMQVQTDCNFGPKRRQIIVFTCRASRRFGYFLVNHVLISVMLCLLTFCSFAVYSKNTHGRLQLCMIILLTSVTFKVVVSQNLPKIPYLTYLDKAVLGNIFLIMCVCLWHTAISILFQTGSLQHHESNVFERIKRIENIMILSLLLGYILSICLFGLIIYFDAGKRRRLMQSKDVEFGRRLQRLELEV